MNPDAKIKVFIDNCQYDSAYVYTQKVIKQSAKNPSKLADYYVKYAKILKSISKSDSCFFYLDKAENYYKKENNTDELFNILTIRAEISRYLVKRNIACNYIYEAEKLYTKNKNLEYKFYFLNRRMALLAEYYNNVPDSVVKIKEIGNLILSNESKIKDKSVIVYTLNELGFLDFNKRPKKALPFFLRAYDVAKKYDTKMAFIDVSINLGRYYQQKEDDFDSAIKYYTEAVKQAKIIDNLWQLQQCYNELKNSTALKNDFKTALVYSDTLIGVNNEIAFYTSNKKYELLENKVIIDAKEKELTNSKKNQLLLLIILISVSCGLAVLWVFMKKIKKTNIQLEKLHKENEFLVRETNHRVNNNLQLISILISDTLKKNISSESKNDFIRLLSKVETIALLHRHLYTSKNKNEIHLNRYLIDVLNNFDEIFAEKNILIKYEIDELYIDSDTAMYLGLLITELIINSIKHAFEENQTKEVLLGILDLDESIKFVYQDNGEKPKEKIVKPKLIDQLCLQLEADYEIDISKGFKLTFNINKHD
ncbi:sensor histidine kinase [Flavobacterium channae]|uniref:sensor histidine kinase n=1 Tax=Flavobacterium channae TaxID=2897181 RepID=UPI001E563D26|nr:sensor histidine kinase [Flavobacterium channae]UGS23362.1 sensor histidine kinase [Flavobacterium channae]